MKYFTLQELIRSNTATSLGIDNTPTQREKIAMTALIDKVLDPVREKWNKPITVSSGYRCQELNKAVGGVANSQHQKGEAADISAGSKTLNGKLFKMIEESNEITFDQMLDEKGLTWIHLSYTETGVNRRMTRKI